MFMKMYFFSLSAKFYLLIVCLVNALSLIRYSGQSSSINRKKYVFAADRIAEHHGYVRMFCSGRICEFQVWFLLNVLKVVLIPCSFDVEFTMHSWPACRITIAWKETWAHLQVRWRLLPWFLVCIIRCILKFDVEYWYRACVSKDLGFGWWVRPWHVTKWGHRNIACDCWRFNSTQSLSIDHHHEL